MVGIVIAAIIVAIILASFYGRKTPHTSALEGFKKFASGFTQYFATNKSPIKIPGGGEIVGDVATKALDGITDAFKSDDDKYKEQKIGLIVSCFLQVAVTLLHRDSIHVPNDKRWPITG